MKKLTLLFLAITLLAFTVGDSKSEYLVPHNANSILIADLENDFDNDIVSGHTFDSFTSWGGAFLMNDGTGNYELMDSIYFDHGFPVVHGNYLDNNEYIDLFSRHQTSNPHKENVVIIYNYGLSQFDSIKVFYLYDNSVVIDDYSSGDIDNDEDNDIVFTCNNDLFWGIIYNDGTGNFSSPEYHDLTFPPIDIACANLNDDNRVDVVISGSDTEIYFSTETGFQQFLLTTTLSHDVLISDFDNDGDNDVITHTTFVYPNHRVYMFENLGNNQFFEHDYFQFSPFCSYAQIADLNNDSLSDMVFIESFGEGLQIFYNQGNFQFNDQQFVPVMFPSLQGLACGDLDNNGFQDIAITHGQGSQEMYVKLLFNDGNGNFLDNPITSTNKIELFKEVPNSSYPNPFKYETTLKFTINENSNVELFVIDLSGRLIKSLINKNMKGGTHSIKWSGTDMTGQACSPGSYIACL
ncbi:MAG: FG-GAP-like repeat-containing protein, partial [Bacteroidales bacterium]|nr:FG-GAP-like repeat-containing protein [Bacteroidales bacterium]